MEIKELLQQIIDTCKENMTSGNWNKNEAMRYAYISLGKELSKSAKFFFSIEGKYGEHGLSVEEMKQIHYADSGKEVTCYVSAKMLKDIFSKLGIECTIIQSAFARPYVAEDGVLDIYHSYLLCTGDEGKKYFLSLNSDLVNIKLNAATEHFGVDVPYIYQGKQSYQGPEIDNDSFTPQQILELDKKIDYAFPVYNPLTDEYVHMYAKLGDPKHDIYGKQKLPYDYLLSHLPYLDQNFSNGYDALFSNFKDQSSKPKTKLTELSTEEIRQVEWYIFERCLDLASSYLGLYATPKKHFAEFFSQPTLDTKKLQEEVNDFVKSHLNSANKHIQKQIQSNPFRILSQAIKFITSIELLSSQSLSKLDKTKRAELKALYLENKTKTSMLFISPEIFDLYTGDKNPTNEFLVEKILSSMEEDFECSTSRTCSYRPIISTKMQAVEQAKFLKDYLRNLLKLELPTESDFQSRVMFSSLAEIGNPDKNAFMIYVKSKDDDPNIHSYSMVYNPETNTIDLASIPKIRFKYKILSKTVNAHINKSSRPSGSTSLSGQSEQPGQTEPNT